MPRKRSERRTRPKKMVYVRKKGLKVVNQIEQLVPTVAAVNFTTEALIKKYMFKNNKCSYEATCLIDTGAAISIINYNTWRKLGEPKMSTSEAGNILLGNNVRVAPEGVCAIKVVVGDYEYPIKLVVMKDWRYDIILGLDFLRAINAIIHPNKGIILARKASVVNANQTVVKRNTRSEYKLIAKESLVIPARHEGRIAVEINGAVPDFKKYLVEGQHLATGVCDNNCQELVVFYRAGTMPHVIKAGDVLGRAILFKESDNGSEENPMAVNNISTDSEDKVVREEHKKKVTDQDIKVDLSKIRVGNLNKKKFFHMLKEHVYTFDGKDPNLHELRKRRRNKEFWNTPESKGRIFTPMDCKPIYIPQYRQSPILMEKAERMNAEWLSAGLTRQSFSSWNAPVLMVPKPGGGLRFCVDYRGLNKITENDSYPMPRIDEILDSLGKACIFSKIDLQWGFYNVELDEKDKAKTAFSLRSGHYEWNVLPMGLRNSPATFQRVMTEVLRPYIGVFVHVFVDDILIYSESQTQHYKHLKIVIEALAQNGFKVNINKSEFGMESLDYLGFQITKDKIMPKTAQVDAILNMKQPTTIGELRSFTGMCNVFRWQIKHFAEKTAPLEDLKKKGMNVVDDWKEEHTRCFQEIKRKIAKKVGTYRVDWSKEIHFGSDASDVGIGAYVFQLDKDGNKLPIHFWSRKLTKTQQNYSTQEKECFALIEGLKALHVYVDGRPFDIYMDHESLKYLMQARYTRKKMMSWAMELQEYQVRDIIHVPGETNCIPDALSRIPLQEFLKSPMEEIKFADTDRYESTAKVDVKEENPFYVVNALGVWKPVKVLNKQEVLQKEQRADELLGKVIEYLEGKFDYDDPSAKKIVSIANNFTVLNGLLYFIQKQRFKSLQRRLCIPSSLKDDILKQVHENGGHQGVHRTYELLHDRFWWENMFKDVCEHIQGCECRLKKLSSNKFNNNKNDHIVVSERWHTLAMDWLYVGRRGKYGSTYVLTVVDLFTRYSLAIPAANKSGQQLVKILRMIFGVYGYPQRIVSDNESMFRSPEFVEWLNTKGIEKTFTAVYNPKANGIDERFNQTLLNMINASSIGREWDVDVWELFYFYNLVTQSTTGVSPFYAHFLREGRLPVDLTYDAKQADVHFSVKDVVHIANKEGIRATEQILKTIQAKHGKLDERKKMLKFRPFKVGDKVILKEPNLETQAKSKPIGKGPFTIHRVMGRNTYKIKDCDGVKAKFLVNGRRLAMIRPRRGKPKVDNETDYFEMIFFPEEKKTVAGNSNVDSEDPNFHSTEDIVLDKPTKVTGRKIPEKEIQEMLKEKEKLEAREARRLKKK